MADLPSLPLFVADYEAATAHLSLEEDGAYSRLLRLCWMTPGCSIPDDDAWIRRRMRVDQDAYDRVVRPIIDEFFSCENGRIFQRRLMKEFKYASRISTERKKAGKKGAENKWRKNNKKTDGKAMDLPVANRWQTDGKPMALTLTLTPNNNTPQTPHTSDPPKSDPIVALLDRLNGILGIDPAKIVSPGWHAAQARQAREWIALGKTDAEIAAIIKAIYDRQKAADPTFAVSTLKYFDEAVRRGTVPKSAEPDPLKGWRPPSGTVNEKELQAYRDAAPIAEARGIPENVWQYPSGRDWIIMLDKALKAGKWYFSQYYAPPHPASTCPKAVADAFPDFVERVGKHDPEYRARMDEIERQRSAK